jgi:acyl phosphate:glycerol-3-phosphate acyltransferase
MDAAWYVWLLLPAAYLLGAVSFAWVAGRLNGIDLRQHGSGNLGATNAGRVLGTRWFVIVFTADVLKGLLPVLTAQLIPCPAEQRPWLLLATAAAAILGHVFTCFHGFKGGKAVATSLGVLAALVWPVAATCLGVFLVVWLIGWRGFGMGKAGAVGISSVSAAFAAPFARMAWCPAPWIMPELPLTVFLILLAILVVAKHRANLQKLFKPS